MSIGLEFQTFVNVWSLSADRERKLLTDYRNALGLPPNSTERANPSDLVLGQLQTWGTALKNGGHLKYFPKGTIMHKMMTQWYLVCDGADMEFVTEPVVMGADRADTNAFRGEDTLKVQMSSLTHFVRRLNRLHRNGSRPAKSNFICRADDPALFNQFPPFLIEWNSKFNCDIEGFPQVTGGIALNRLRKLFRYFSQNEDSEFTKKLLGGSRAASYARSLGRVVDNLKPSQIKDSRWNGHSPSSTLRGLVSIIGVYLTKGKASKYGGNKIPVVKHLLFLMARTNFSTMFEQLPNDEKTHYRNNPGDWVNFICNEMMPLIDNEGPYTPNGRMFEYLITDYNKLQPGKEVQIPITREEWLIGMTQGRDLFSECAHPIKYWDKSNRRKYRDAHGEHRLRGAGALGDKMDHIAVGQLSKNGIIFEFRGPGWDGMMMPFEDWSDYALKSFRFLAALNIHSKEERLEEFDYDMIDLGSLF